MTTFRRDVAKESRFGPQPARDVMVRQRWNCAAAARDLGVTYRHLYNVLVGHTPPSPTVRDRLPVILDTPLEELFTTAALSERYWARFNGHKNKVPS